MLTKAIIASAALLALTGCATSSTPHPLTGSEWQLTTIDTSGSSTTLVPALQVRHRLSFGEEGQLALQLDCNRGRASWSAGKPRNGAGPITIGPVASTRALCPEPSFGGEMASGLSEARTYTLSTDQRELVIETGTLRFTFSSAP